MFEPLPKEVLWNRMEDLDYPHQKEETARGFRKENQVGELRRVTTLWLLTNDSKSRGARIQGGWMAMMSDGGYEAKSSSSAVV